MEYRLPKRPKDSHKGTFGKVLNIAGSYNYTGAAYLSSVAALRAGCGLVALSAPECVINAVAAQTPDVVFMNRKDSLEHLSAYTVVSVGCGLDVKDETKEFFIQLVLQLCELEKPTVIDASGLTLLAQSGIKTLPSNFVLTPHVGEASRLMDVGIIEITQNPDFWVTKMVDKFGCVCLLKGMNTRVCNFDGEIYVNKTGCSGLAKAGSGDVLCGMIAGIMAQGVNSYEAAKIAVYLHGKAGENAAKSRGEHGVLASDLLNYI